VLASRVRDWVVMTDELQYAKLATHIGETLSPLPTLRGAHFAAYAQLYPALLSPLYGSLSAPGAFRAAHVLNGVLFASAAVPAYLLAREAALSRRWALVVALLCVAAPSNLLTAFVMTESAAYPAFLWASFAMLRAVAAPSRRRDAVALVVLALAVLARTQFVALGLVFVVAALIYERRGHRILVVASGAAFVVAAVGGSRVLGSYAVTADRWPLPWKAFEQAGAHLDVAGIGVALLPLLLGGAWIVANALRREPFALLALATIVVLTLEVSSYDARFGGGPVGIRERYVFYLGPLLLVAMARSLVEASIPRVALAATTAFVAVTVFAYDFPRVQGVHVDSPVAVLNGWIRDAGGASFIAVAAIVLALAVTVPPWRRRTLAAVCVALVFAGSTGTSAVAWSRLLESRSPSSREIAKPSPAVLNWIDGVLPKGAHVAIVPYATYGYWGPNALLWWNTEFWNKDVDRAYVVGDTWDYAPFPHAELRVDRTTGIVAGTEHAPPYVVAAASDARLQLDGTRVGTNYGLDILQVARPYRALWTSSGLDPDGWTQPGRPARIHVFAGASAAVSLQRADGSAASVCGAGDITLPDAATGSVAVLPLQPTATGTRTVGVRVTSVETRPSC
jgi:hypothetical protein